MIPMGSWLFGIFISSNDLNSSSTLQYVLATRFYTSYLTHQSDVLSVSFSPYHPTLIFGGSYSGQVLLWDTRAKHLPVLKTPLSATGHTYPIYGMKVVGTQNANNLITGSTDGLVCSWLSDVLAQPQVRHDSVFLKAGLEHR